MGQVLVKRTLRRKFSGANSRPLGLALAGSGYHSISSAFEDVGTRGEHRETHIRFVSHIRAPMIFERLGKFVNAPAGAPCSPDCSAI